MPQLTVSTTARPTVPVDHLDDDACWAAVCRRDPEADGLFWYGVATTGVYCRPSCAARQPRRENVRFYETQPAAQRAGYRPCRRCRPDQPAEATRTADLVAAACRTIEAAETPPSLGDLAADAGLSPWHFHRVFKTATGVTPRAYAAARRDQRVKEELQRPGTVTRAIFDAGYNASSRFYETAEATLGMTPRAWRNGGAGAEIRCAVRPCSLGWVLVAATERGVCAIRFGDAPEPLLSELHRQFPKARRTDDPDFDAWVSAIVAAVEAPARQVELPLDIRGTAFQQQVWQALRRIPPGTTLSYKAVAEAIGRPQAVRAVAQACGANPVAVAIPCHRVVGTDGTLGGYHWGVERKRHLLAREAAG